MQKNFARFFLFLLVVGAAGISGGCTTKEIATTSSGVAPLGDNKFAVSRNTLFEQTQWFQGSGSVLGVNNARVIYFWKNQPPIVIDCSKNEAEECFASEGR